MCFQYWHPVLWFRWDNCDSGCTMFQDAGTMTVRYKGQLFLVGK